MTGSDDNYLFDDQEGTGVILPCADWDEARAIAAASGYELIGQHVFTEVIPDNRTIN